MLLAGNGSTPMQNMTVSTPKLKPEVSIPSKKDGFIISQSYPSLSPLPSPLPMTSHASSHPRGGSSSNNELTIIRPVGPSTAPTNHLESPVVAGSVGSAATKMIQPGIFIPWSLYLCREMLATRSLTLSFQHFFYIIVKFSASLCNAHSNK